MSATTLLVTLAGTDPADDSTVHEVTILNPDRLRAEQMAVKLRVPAMKDAPLTHMTLWAWAALKRTGHTAADAATFLNDLCLDVDKARDEAVDPTQPGPDTTSP